MGRTKESELRQASFVARTALLAFAGGLRSQVPFLTLGISAAQGNFARNTPGLVGLYRRRDVQLLTGASAVGEMLVDKLPFVPSRLDPPSFVGRLMFGGVAGAAFARGKEHSPALGFAVGAVAAGLGAYAGYHARRVVGEETGLPDPVVALAEDAIALGMGGVAVNGS